MYIKGASMRLSNRTNTYSDLAATYAALILADEGLEITVRIKNCGPRHQSWPLDGLDKLTRAERQDC